MYWENEVPGRTQTSQEIWSWRAFTPRGGNTCSCQQPATMILPRGAGLVPGSNRMPERIGLLTVSVLYGIVSMATHAQEPRERATLARFLRVSRHANDAVKDGNCKQSYSFRHSVTSGH